MHDTLLGIVVNHPQHRVDSPGLLDGGTREHAIVPNKGSRAPTVLVDLLLELVDNDLVVVYAVNYPVLPLVLVYDAEQEVPGTWGREGHAGWRLSGGGCGCTANGIVVQGDGRDGRTA